MKRLATVAVLLAWLMACEARAEIGFVVSAANLQDQSGNLASTRGLVLLVVDTVGSGFTTNVLPTSPLSVGSFLTGSGMPTNDLIVGAWDLSSLSTQGQLIAYTIISYSPPIAASQAVALYWFPSLTLASTTAGPGTPFGFYTDPVGIDGSAPWVLPVDGANPGRSCPVELLHREPGWIEFEYHRPGLLHHLDLLPSLADPVLRKHHQLERATGCRPAWQGYE